METLGSVANIFGVITPAKDIGEIIKAIADSVDNVKRNKYRISMLIKILKDHVQTLHKARERYEVEGGTIRQIESLQNLQISLFLVWKELAELNQTQSNSGLFGLTFRQWWSASGVKAKIEQLEMDIKQCRELFLFDSLDGLRQEVNVVKRILVGDGDGRRTNYQVQCTTTMWKIPLKADLSDPKTVNYTYLRNKIIGLSNTLRSNGPLISQLLRSNANHFIITPIDLGRYPIGDPTSECEDASHLAIKLTRTIQDQNSHFSIIDWFDDIYRLAFAVHNVGLWKEAQQICQFEYYMITLITSEQGNNLDSYLMCCLYNLALSYHGEDREVEALTLLKRVVEMDRRLGPSFIPNLADSLHLLSACFHDLGQYKKAAELIQESIDLFQGLVSKDPLQYGREMADCLTDKANLHYKLREYQKAADHCEKAIQSLSKFSARSKEETPCDYARVRWIAALAYKKLGNFGRAEEYGKEASMVFNKLIRERPLYYLGYSKAAELSTWFHEADRHKDAIYILEESLSVYCSVIPSFAVQKEFADVLYQRAEILHSNDKFTDALDALSQVIDVRRHLLEENETDVDCFVDLLSAFKLRCSCLISLRRPSEAMKNIETVLNMLRPSIIKVEFEKSYRTLLDLVEQESMLEEMDSTEHVSKLMKYKKVLSTIDDAIVFWRRREYPYLNLIWLLRLRYDILYRMNKHDFALLTIQEVIDLYRCKVDKNGDAESLSGLINALVSQADCLEKMDRIDDALTSLVDVLMYLKSDDNRDKLLIDSILSLLNSLVENLIDRNKHSMALQALNMFENIIRSMIVGQTCDVKSNFAVMLTRRSECYFELERFVEAVHDAEEVVEICRCVVAEDTGQYGGLNSLYLAECLYEHARKSLALNNNNSALKSVEESIDISSQIELEYSESIEDDLKDCFMLRNDILCRLGRAADIQDELSKT